MSGQINRAATVPSETTDQQRERRIGAILPPSLPPRGLSRVQAAAYVGISPSLFDQMVQDGRMPKPTRINARAVWDRHKIDAAFACLGGDEEDINPWDQ